MCNNSNKSEEKNLKHDTPTNVTINHGTQEIQDMLTGNITELNFKEKLKKDNCNRNSEKNPEDTVISCETNRTSGGQKAVSGKKATDITSSENSKSPSQAITGNKSLSHCVDKDDKAIYFIEGGKGFKICSRKESEKSFPCKQCGRIFPRMRELNKHVWTHTKPHKCDECDKSFGQLHSLQRHQVVHTGERPYSCTQCGNLFSQAISLKRHELIHRGEKPFSCTQCDKTFTEAVALHRHETVHSKEKRFICNECGKVYAQSSTLSTHKKVHKCNTTKLKRKKK